MKADRPHDQAAALEAARSALRVIHTWASVQIDHPARLVLDPQHVIDQCRRGLGMTSAGTQRIISQCPQYIIDQCWRDWV